MSIFGFKSKKGEVLNHWISFIDGFSYPPQDFYAEIEKELVARSIPSMDISRVEFTEGGPLSDKRVYLRMIRERLIFDTCATPFGSGYIFSCRTVFIPPVIKLWHILVVLLFFKAVDSVLTQLLDPLFAWIAFGALALAIIQVFRNPIAMGLSDLDATLIKTPVAGPIYERLFRKDTYFRQDTRLFYLEAVPKLVRAMAEETTAAKGVKLMRQYQLAPVLGGLYQPVPPDIEDLPVWPQSTKT